MTLSFCLHCHNTTMTERGCLLCGGGCGRIATEKEKDKTISNLVHHYKGVTENLNTQLRKNVR